MLDVSLLRDRRDVLARSLERRGLSVDLDALAAIDEERRRVRAAAEEMRSEQKRAGKEISQLEGDAKQAAIAEMGALAESYKAALAEADELDGRFDEVWRTLPNVADESAAEGRTDEDNVEVRSWGIADQNAAGADHVDMGAEMGLIEIERAAKVSGSRFAYLTGELVMLELALVRWALGLLQDKGFIPVSPPVLVREEALFGTGFFPSARDQVYAVGVSDESGEIVEGDGLYLVGTSEVPIAALHSDEIFDQGALPLRYAGFSTCFRREAGTYGKDTRGIFRVHQFDKVEMFSFVEEDASWEEHDRLLAIEEEIFQQLEIPYRVMNVAVGDLGDSAAKKYDIEAWFPGQQAYREITSCSNTTDFQARRLGVRYRDENGKTRLAHTLNGTALAVGRTLIALMENHRRSDGSIAIPEVIQPFYGSDSIGP